MIVKGRYKCFKWCFTSNRLWGDSIPVALWHALRYKFFDTDFMERIQTVGSPLDDDNQEVTP